MTHADMTVFPTTVFMEFMLPRVFGWSPFCTEEDTQFPKLSAWSLFLKKNHPDFKLAHSDCYNFWQGKWEEGQFDSIIAQVKADKKYKWLYP